VRFALPEGGEADGMTNGDGSDIRDALQRWVIRVHKDFGVESGSAIVQSLLEECSGCRIRIPSEYELYRRERDCAIRRYFTGQNHEELAIRFSLTVRQVRNILRNE
jgi:Mor family transcriptional regulator